ncbi:MAG TPA: DnaB-like helicase C-terminal domain-containing protein, partial [Candidatus Paceibacterota bacterium]
FSIIKQRFTEGEQIDAISLSNALADKMAPNGQSNFLVWIGGAPYIHTLMESIPSVANVDHYANIIADKSLRRKVQVAAIRVSDMASMPGVVGEAGLLVNRAISQFEGLQSRGRNGVSMSSVVDAYIADLQNGVASRSGLHTGFTDLDQLLGPLRPGHLMVIAGRPGQGKSVLGADIGRHVSKNMNNRVLYVTLEMSAEELSVRNISAISNVEFDKLRDGIVNADEVTRLEMASAQWESVPFTILERSRIELAEVNSELRRAETAGNPFSMVIVDYLQLLQTNSKLFNREQQVAELSREGKIIARERNVVFVLLAQLNRGPEQRNDKRPQLSDLRESGAIEQDADSVVMIHRPEYYDKNDKPGNCYLLLVKNRHGQTGTATVVSQLHYQKFVDPAIPVIR